MPGSRPTSFGVTALLVVGLILAAFGPLGTVAGPGRVVAAQPVPGCEEGAELIRNGSFESPGIDGPYPVDGYVAAPWSAVTGMPTWTADFQMNHTIEADGRVVAGLGRGQSVTQPVSVAGLANATLTLSMNRDPLFYPGSASLGDQGIRLYSSGGTVVVTPQQAALGQLDLRISAFADYSAVIDSVSLKVTTCGGPTLSIPGDITLDGGPSDSAMAEFSVSAIDSQGTVVVPVCTIGEETVTSPLVRRVGTYPVECRATDGAGRTTTRGFTIIVRDTRPPVLDESTLPGVPTGGNSRLLELGPPTDGQAPYVWPSIYAMDSIDGRVQGGCIVELDEPDPVIGPVVPIPPGTTISGVGADEIIALCSASDRSGNRSETVTIIIRASEPAPPVVTVPGNLSFDGDETNTALVRFDATATDGTGDTSLTVTCTLDDTDETITSGARLPVGIHPITCRATDDGDREGAASFTVTVLDRAAPVFDESTLPGILSNTGSRTLVIDTTTGQATVTWGPVVARDVGGISEPVTVSCVRDADGDPETPGTEPVAGNGFTAGLGSHVVTCRAEDTAGNSATTSFTVVIRDDTPPTIVVPEDISVAGGASDRARVTFEPPTATDNEDRPISEVVCALADGTPVSSGVIVPVGVHSVTCRATDGDGRTGTASFTITVRDTSGPTITWNGGPLAGRTYTTATVPARPTCSASETGSPVLQCTVTGYSDQPGRHILMARARDDAGNTTIQTRTYTVTSVVPTATPPTTVPPTLTPPAPVPTTSPTRPVRPVTTRPPRTPVPTATPAPTQPPSGPTRPPRR